MPDSSGEQVRRLLLVAADLRQRCSERPDRAQSDRCCNMHQGLQKPEKRSLDVVLCGCPVMDGGDLFVISGGLEMAYAKCVHIVIACFEPLCARLGRVAENRLFDATSSHKVEQSMVHLSQGQSVTTF